MQLLFHPNAHDWSEKRLSFTHRVGVLRFFNEIPFNRILYQNGSSEKLIRNNATDDFMPSPSDSNLVVHIYLKKKKKKIAHSFYHLLTVSTVGSIKWCILSIIRKNSRNNGWIQLNWQMPSGIRKKECQKTADHQSSWPFMEHIRSSCRLITIFHH